MNLITACLWRLSFWLIFSLFFFFVIVVPMQIESYTKEIEEMEKVTKEEYLASLRRRSSGFSRGVSKYRGVAR